MPQRQRCFAKPGRCPDYDADYERFVPKMQSKGFEKQSPERLPLTLT